MLSVPQRFCMQTLSNPGGMIFAAVHSKSRLTLSTPDPFTRTAAVIVAEVNAATAEVDMAFGFPIVFQKKIEANRVDDNFIPKGIFEEAERRCFRRPRYFCILLFYCNCNSTAVIWCSAMMISDMNSMFVNQAMRWPLQGSYKPLFSSWSEYLYFISRDAQNVMMIHHHHAWCERIICARLKSDDVFYILYFIYALLLYKLCVEK